MTSYVIRRRDQRRRERMIDEAVRRSKRRMPLRWDFLLWRRDQGLPMAEPGDRSIEAVRAEFRRLASR